MPSDRQAAREKAALEADEAQNWGDENARNGTALIFRNGVRAGFDAGVRWAATRDEDTGLRDAGRAIERGIRRAEDETPECEQAETYVAVCEALREARAALAAAPVSDAKGGWSASYEWDDGTYKAESGAQFDVLPAARGADEGKAKDYEAKPLGAAGGDK